MILSKHDIQQELDSSRLVIEPEPRIVDQVSIDLHLGREFSFFKVPDYISSIRVRAPLFQEEKDTLWETKEGGESYRLKPNDFVLAQTLERVTLPPHLMGFVEGRSSWARTGISVHFAPKIDPGFEGTITLEMTNHGKVAVDLFVGEDAPAQLILMEVKTPLAEGEVYGARPTDIFHRQGSPLPQRPSTQR